MNIGIIQKIVDSDIERQAMTDVAKYRKIYEEKYGSFSTNNLDVENMIEELWGYKVGYVDISTYSEEDVLGLTDFKKKKVFIKQELCKTDRRMAFTMAHEAGHISLHSFVFLSRKTPVSLKGESLIERQADLYAASLLAPKEEIIRLLTRIGKGINNMPPVDLTADEHYFMDSFGLSRQALEIRLKRLQIPTINGRYIKNKN
jgi:Zn-dependent peptidase ImmA (M78 family)